MKNGPNASLIQELYRKQDGLTRERIDQAAAGMAAAKAKGGRIVVVTGSGPNIHEGVTTLLAELIHKGLVDGVITSSAVIAHEMAGSLDRVKRVAGSHLDLDESFLPRGAMFETTVLDEPALTELEQEMVLDREMIRAAMKAPGETIVKAAGNVAYPMGLWTEQAALEIEHLAHMTGKSFEEIAGSGADPYTMIGAGYLKRSPVLVSVPQLIGGGLVGLAIGDSIPLKRRSALIAEILSQAEVIIESGVALTQEIHDGPFETYLGHGIWSAWQGHKTFSLENKTLIRIDLDPNLSQVWQWERNAGRIQNAIDRGLPKTKILRVPFRMEMSGFARLENSLPITAELGAVWPVLASRLAEALGVALDFMSYPQETPAGCEMRSWIVENVKPLNRKQMRKRSMASQWPG